VIHKFELDPVHRRIRGATFVGATEEAYELAWPAKRWMRAEALLFALDQPVGRIVRQRAKRFCSDADNFDGGQRHDLLAGLQSHALFDATQDVAGFEFPPAEAACHRFRAGADLVFGQHKADISHGQFRELM